MSKNNKTPINFIWKVEDSKYSEELEELEELQEWDKAEVERDLSTIIMENINISEAKSIRAYMYVARDINGSRTLSYEVFVNNIQVESLKSVAGAFPLSDPSIINPRNI